MSLKLALLIAVLSVLLIAASWFALDLMTSIPLAMNGHGWFAMALGVGFSLLVGVVLMSLVFFSSRRGYDDIERDD